MIKYAAAPIALLGGLFLAVSANAVDLPQTRILKIDVTIKGTESWAKDGSKYRSDVAGRVYFATALRSSDELHESNEFDLDNTGAQGFNANPAAGLPAAPAGAAIPQVPGTDQQKMMQMVMEAQQKCAGDESCMQQFAAEYTAKMTAQMQAAYPNMDPSTFKAGAEDYAEPEAIFLPFEGFENCPVKVISDLRITSSGHYQDTQGPVPVDQKITALVRSAEPSQMFICNDYRGKLDTRSDTYFTYGTFVLPYFEGDSVVTAKGQSKESKVQIALPAEVTAWLAELVKKMPVSGSQTKTFRLSQPAFAIDTVGGNSAEGADFNSAVEVTVRWSFTDILPKGAKAESLPEQ